MSWYVELSIIWQVYFKHQRAKDTTYPLKSAQWMVTIVIDTDTTRN